MEAITEIRLLGLHIRAEQDVWVPRRLGAGACASEILGVRQSSNVTAISGKHYFHQSNFHFTQHHFHPEKIYLGLLSFFALIQPIFMLIKKGLFSSKEYTLRNIIHCICILSKR